MGNKIKIAVDIRDLQIAKTGAKTYLEEICKVLQKGHPDFTFFFINTWLPVYTGKNKVLKAVEHARFFCWKQISLPFICLVKGVDILYCTDYFLPLLKFNFKTAVVFYDAFFWEYPNQYNRLWLGLLKTVGVTAAKKPMQSLPLLSIQKNKLYNMWASTQLKCMLFILHPKQHQHFSIHK